MSNEKTVLQLCYDAYYGTGGFEFGAQDGTLDSQADTRIGSYLVKHPREHVDSYNARRKVAYYLNYMAPVVDSHVAPLFRREAERKTVTSSAEELWIAFMDDADGAGSGLAQVMRNAAMPAKRDGVAFLVVTAPEVAPANRAQALQIKPYVYLVEALDVVAIKRDRFGRVVSLSHLESRDGEERPVVRQLRPDGWAVLNDKGEEIDSGEFATPYPTAPVVEIATGAKVRGAMLPRSSFVAIARTCHRLFNLCSELDEIFRAQTFSILLYPSRDLSELTIGLNNALGFDGEGKHAPGFIAPPDGPAKVLMEQFDRLVREIYRMALLTHQTGSTNSNQQQNLASGVALRIDREALDTALGDFAGTLEKAEMQVAALWAWWTDESLEYTVGYPRDFVLQDEKTTLQPLLDAYAAILADMPPVLKSGLMQRIGTILLEDDAGRLEQLIEYLNQADIDAANTPPPNSTQEGAAADGSGEGGTVA